MCVLVGLYECYLPCSICVYLPAGACANVCTCVVIAAVPGQNTGENQWIEGTAH